MALNILLGEKRLKLYIFIKLFLKCLQVKITDCNVLEMNEFERYLKANATLSEHDEKHNFCLIRFVAGRYYVYNSNNLHRKI